MKKLKELKGFEILTKNKQKSIGGGARQIFNCPKKWNSNIECD